MKKKKRPPISKKVARLVWDYVSERLDAGEDRDILTLQITAAVLNACHDQMKRGLKTLDDVAAAKAAIAKCRERDAGSHAVH